MKLLFVALASICLFQLALDFKASANEFFKPVDRLNIASAKKERHKMVPADPLLSLPSMLEISTRPWLYLLSQKYRVNITRLKDILTQEFEKIKNDGYQIVWLMGVWHLGPYGLNFDRTNPSLRSYYDQVLPGWTIDDVIGSPYAITEYVCNPTLGTDSELVALKQRLNALGLKLMLDFVPNHSAVDSPWTTQHIDWYVRAPKGSKPPYDPNVYLPNGIAYGSAGGGSAWLDTAQLNYWSPELRAEQINNILKIASMSDYIRCDMAYLLLNDVIAQNWGTQLSSWGYGRPPTEFWRDAIALAKQKFPHIQFLAEVYDPWVQTLQALGFDWTYDKGLYDRLGNGNLDNLREYISGLPLSYHVHAARFIENHDEPRAVAFFGSTWRADAAALVTYTLPGMRFYFMGQREGYANRLDIHLRRALPEEKHSDTELTYRLLLNITSDVTFHIGTWTYLNVFGADSAWRLMAWKWAYGDSKRLCVVNYSDAEGQGRVLVPDAVPRSGNDTIPVNDLLSGATYYRSAHEMRTQGLYVIIPKWWAQIFSY